MKQIILINEKLSPGEAANTCAVIGMSFGKLNPSVIGENVSDGSRNIHSGITKLTLPVLRADPAEIKSIYIEVQEKYPDSVSAVPFTEIARASKNYDEYAEKLGATEITDIEFAGLGLTGDRKTINRISGHLKLF